MAKSRRLKMGISVLALGFLMAPKADSSTPPPQVVLETAFVLQAKPVSKAPTQQDVGHIIPVNLQPGQPMDHLGHRIADHSVNTFLQGDMFRDSELGKTASAMEKALRTNLIFGSGKPDEVQHSLNMQVMALEGMAKVEYRGLLTMDLTYRAAEGLNVAVIEPLSSSTTLKLNHISDTSSVNLVYGF